MNKMSVKKATNRRADLKQFVKTVKAGRYATIEKSSIKYSRIREQAEVKGIDTEEYYYSMS